MKSFPFETRNASTFGWRALHALQLHNIKRTCTRPVAALAAIPCRQAKPPSPQQCQRIHPAMAHPAYSSTPPIKELKCTANCRSHANAMLKGQSCLQLASSSASILVCAPCMLFSFTDSGAHVHNRLRKSCQCRVKRLERNLHALQLHWFRRKHTRLIARVMLIPC